MATRKKVVHRAQPVTQFSWGIQCAAHPKDARGLMHLVGLYSLRAILHVNLLTAGLFSEKYAPKLFSFSCRANASKSNYYMERQSSPFCYQCNPDSLAIPEGLRNAKFNNIRLPFQNCGREGKCRGWKKSLKQKHPDVIDRCNYS